MRPLPASWAGDGRVRYGRRLDAAGVRDLELPLRTRRRFPRRRARGAPASGERGHDRAHPREGPGRPRRCTTTPPRVDALAADLARRDLRDLAWDNQQALAVARAAAAAPAQS